MAELEGLPEPDGIQPRLLGRTGPSAISRCYLIGTVSTTTFPVPEKTQFLITTSKGKGRGVSLSNFQLHPRVDAGHSNKSKESESRECFPLLPKVNCSIFRRPDQFDWGLVDMVRVARFLTLGGNGFMQSSRVPFHPPPAAIRIRNRRRSVSGSNSTPARLLISLATPSAN